MDRLPRVYQTLMELQMLDITTDPDRDRAHGALLDGRGLGAPVDHGTDVEGLYAIGEASSGLHGANRLGGNSLIELLVYGRIVGQAAAAYSARLDAQHRCRAAVSEARDEVDDLLSADGPENVRSLQRAIRNTMTEHAGVVRDEQGCAPGSTELDEIEERIERRRRPPRHRRASTTWPTPSTCKACAARRAGDPRGGAGAARDPRLPQPFGLPGPRRRAPGQPGVVRSRSHRT